MKRILFSILLSLSTAIAIAAPPAKHKPAPAAQKAAATACVIAAAGAPLTMTLNFVPPTLNANGTPITLPLTYDIYLGTTSGARRCW